MGELPTEHGLFSITPSNLIMSALKKAEDRDSFILRVYNPTDRPINGNINIYSTVKKAYVTNLNEERLKEIAVNEEHSIQVEIGSNKIETIELVINAI